MNDWYRVDNSDEMASPALLIYPDRIENNLGKMITFAGGPQKLRPHVKTHKLPQVIEMKRQLKINKFKASTLAEAKMTSLAGGRDVLLAMQPVGPAISQLTDLIVDHPKTQFSTIVDNPESVGAIASAASEAEVKVSLYVDLNVGMDRTGIRPDSKAMQLYQLIDQGRHLVAVGLHAYDGHVHCLQGEKLTRKVQETFAPVLELASQIREKGMTRPKLVFGGTPTSWTAAQMFDDLADDIEVSAGTSVLWDAGQMSHSPGQDFQHAAVLMTRVVSKPTDSTLCLDLGHKAVASEFPAPRVMWINLDTATEIAHSEEHLVIQTDQANEFQVGSVIYGIPYHVCPTVALHERVHVVEDNHAFDTWHVIARTRFVD